MDDKFEPDNGDWERKRWRFDCHVGDISCSVYAPSDDTTAFPAEVEDFALDPMTRNYLTGGYGAIIGATHERATPELSLGVARQIQNMVFTNCGTIEEGRSIIFFDEIGRPYALNGSYPTNSPKLLGARCEITLTHIDGESAKVCVEPETGRVHDGC